MFNFRKFRAYSYGANRSFRPSSPSSYASSYSQTLPANTIVKFVPQQQSWIVERFGKFHRKLEPGLAILLPFIDQIRYVQNLKEVAVEVPTQSAITQDNVAITMDGVLYYRIVDPFKASYGVEDADFAITQLAQTTMRSEIGQMTLDKTLAERNQLNASIVQAINEAAQNWGILCLRYEIRDIQPPDLVVKAMHSQVSAERQKRAQILESEGSRQSAINRAEGEKRAAILASEGQRQERINLANGEAEAQIARATATAEAILRVSEAITKGGDGAVKLMLAERYIDAFAQLAQKSTTLMLPGSFGGSGGSDGAVSPPLDPASFVSQAVAIYQKMHTKP